MINNIVVEQRGTSVKTDDVPDHYFPSGQEREGPISLLDLQGRSGYHGTVNNATHWEGPNERNGEADNVTRREQTSHVLDVDPGVVGSRATWRCHKHHRKSLAKKQKWESRLHSSNMGEGGLVEGECEGKGAKGGLCSGPRV
jgi:hypothetical protein